MEREIQPGVLRIGELSRRVGISDHVLRAWEIRYGLLAPVRSPELIVVAATTTDRFTGILSELSQLAAVAPLALAGAGATQQMADDTGARLLSDDPVTAAQHQGHGW